MRTQSLKTLADAGGWLNFGKLPTGIYIVTVRFETGQTVSQKLVVGGF